MTLIAPSILSADFARLAEDIQRVEAAGAQWLHVDVMDGHFVPNITIGPPVVRSVRAVTRLSLDVHLMIEEPDRYIPAFAEAGADTITVHAEAATHLDRTIGLIRSVGASPGVALNPATSLSALDHVLELLDLVLVMSVNPGFGGQKFIPYTLEKVRSLRQRITMRNASCRIEVDGGIDLDTLGEVVRAGADVLVAGSAIFHAPDPGARVKEMLALASRLSYDSKYV